MELACAAIATPRRRPRPSSLAAPDRRTLGLVLGFLGGLAALGPIAGLATATLAWAIARLAESR